MRTTKDIRRITFYVDGACHPNPGPMGAGIVCYRDGERREWGVGLELGTNQRAELFAVREALLSVEDRETARVTIYTDSRYAIGVLQHNWKAKVNLDLISPLRVLIREFASVNMKFVKGHAGSSQNERADALASGALLWTARTPIAISEAEATG